MLFICLEIVIKKSPVVMIFLSITFCRRTNVPLNATDLQQYSKLNYFANHLFAASECFCLKIKGNGSSDLSFLFPCLFSRERQSNKGEVVIKQE